MVVLIIKTLEEQKIIFWIQRKIDISFELQNRIASTIATFLLEII